MKLLTAAIALAAPLLAAELGSSSDRTNPNQVVAHEWGTFTSVAGANGDPVRWSALAGPPELPCFVQHGGAFKSELADLVRMETPVLYFYSGQPAKVSVKVNFPLGHITEFYPAASRVPVHGLEYDSVELMPGPDPVYPTTSGESRYYPARNTDATPLRINGQVEKMIFYRGVGGLPVPLRPTFNADGKVEIRNVSDDSIPMAFLFENRDGRLGFRVLRDVREPAAVDPPELNQSASTIGNALMNALSASGLYLKEAQAMLATWNDSWFEEGTRLIYIVPQRQVDALLPLTIEPRPAETKRAFVGRIEILSPAREQEIRTALTKQDAVALKSFGRFLEPFALRTGLTRSNPAYAKAIRELQPLTGSCVQ